MTAASQTATSKVQQKDEQSEEENTAMLLGTTKMYIGQTCRVHISLHTYVQTVHLCIVHTYVRTYLLEPKGINMVEPPGHYCNCLVQSICNHEPVRMYIHTYIHVYV